MDNSTLTLLLLLLHKRKRNLTIGTGKRTIWAYKWLQDRDESFSGKLMKFIYESIFKKKLNCLKLIFILYSIIIYYTYRYKFNTNLFILHNSLN